MANQICYKTLYWIIKKKKKKKKKKEKEKEKEKLNVVALFTF
jgi:hypothetical protein